MHGKWPMADYYFVLCNGYESLYHEAGLLQLLRKKHYVGHYSSDHTIVRNSQQIFMYIKMKVTGRYISETLHKPQEREGREHFDGYSKRGRQCTEQTHGCKGE